MLPIGALDYDAIDTQPSTSDLLKTTNVSAITTTDPNYSFQAPNSSEANLNDSQEQTNDLTVAGIVLLSIGFFVLMVLTVLGNFLVILSYKINRQLQTVNNMFLVSLACSDLIIGLVSMTFYPIYTIAGKWTLGPLLCDIWLCVDYTLSMASVANLMLICLDRYFSVTRPFTYRAKRTYSRARLFIVLAWIFSFLLWSPAIIIWPRTRMRTTGDQCYIQFLEEDKTLTVVTALLAFYLPVLVMCVLYGLIYRETKKCSQYLEYLKSYRSNRSNTAPSPLLPPNEGNQRVSLTYQLSQDSGNPGNRPRFLSVDQGISRRMRFRLGSFTLCATNGSEQHDVYESNLDYPQCAARGSSLFKNLNGSATTSLREEASVDPASAKTFYLEGNDEPATEANGLTAYDTTMENNNRAKLLFSRSPASGRITRTRSEPGAFQRYQVSNGVLDPTAAPVAAPDASANVDREKQSSRKNFFHGCVKRRKRKSSSEVKMPSSEKKAARTLSAILLAFIITWTPYNICAVYKSFCSDDCEASVPKAIWYLSYYLCYLNSTINPFCFALINKTFRSTFREILFCKKCRRVEFQTSAKSGSKVAKPGGLAVSSSSSK